MSFMSLTILVAGAYLVSPSSARADEMGGATPAPQPSHQVHKGHKHQHGSKDCHHKAEQHGDHVDYEDDGHHHKKHGDHWDECSGPEADGKVQSKDQPKKSE